MSTQNKVEQGGQPVFSVAEIDALAWVIGQAANWKGCIPDDGDRDAYMEHIGEAQVVLAKIKGLRK